MRRLQLLAALAVFALPAPGVLGGSSAQAASATNGQLSHEGRWITDKRGRVVILHGWNLVSKVGSYRPEDTGFGANDARFLKRHGFNTIRLGVIYKALEPKAPGADGRPRYNRAYIRSIKRTQRMLARHGIYTLLDFHQDLYNERFEGEGWPDWQVLDDGVPSEPKQGFPNNYVVNLGLQRAFDNFWANTPVQGVGLQDRYAAAWRYVAQRFRRARRLVGYNIINEPWPGSEYPTCLSPTGCPVFDTQTLQPFSERVIAAIRQADPRTLVWYAPLVIFDFGADTSHGDTGDEHAGFAFNMYCLAGGFLPTNPAGELSCSETYELTLDNADTQAEQTGDALLMTEYAATDDIDIIEEINELADDHMVGWQQWHYCECDDPTTAGTGIQSVVQDPRKPPRGENLNRDKLVASARPYPQAVAGTPLSYGFDSQSRTFELTYSTTTPAGTRLRRRGAATRVVVPRLHYPGGYEVKATGARAVSRPGARVLRLRRHRGAGEVGVVVTPAS
ncbi:MAG: cellulase family glycosylhydrolase [Solirubrobacterales bacterium]